MSVTGHRDIRLQDDAYMTPAWCVRALLPYLKRGKVLEPCCGNGAIGKVLAEEWPEQERYGIEIDAGRTHQARAAQILRVDGTPLRAFDNVVEGDFLTNVSDSKRAPIIITNPPFKLALEFAKKAVGMADTVAFLLRLNWLASAERRPFHRAHPADIIVLPRRPSFAQFLNCGGRPRSPMGMAPALAPCVWKDVIESSAERPQSCPQCGGAVKASTTDSTEYAWFIWGEGRGGRYCIANEDFTPAVDWSQVRGDMLEAEAALDAVEQTLRPRRTRLESGGVKA